ncbi:SCP2 sterol-binding domain-containing protein [Paucisalibacillus globulus]|uniref:SCP2 sterol-binding domain-containing protein n=1 Tax=Paucisalibacillus globulus TaxID=351095 RepID=UPI00042A7E06|nr:SCP2 sterol-binding domain-containing protein [Paucisalibacillus globulus]
MEEVKKLFSEIDTALKEDPGSAKGIEAVYQFKFHKDESHTFQLILNGDNSFAAEGKHENPDCTLVMVKEDFLAMANGELNGTKAFMSGRLKIKGNMGLALKLQDILASYNKSRN